MYSIILKLRLSKFLCFSHVYPKYISIENGGPVDPPQENQPLVGSFNGILVVQRALSELLKRPAMETGAGIRGSVGWLLGCRVCEAVSDVHKFEFLNSSNSSLFDDETGLVWKWSLEELWDVEKTSASAACTLVRWNVSMIS